MTHFLKEQVEGSRPDGYWLEAFPYKVTDSKAPNLIGYGLGTSEQSSKIHMYTNPYGAHSSEESDHSEWKKTEIAELRFPVACTVADITGNGYNDLILSDEYGPSMKDIWQDGGRVSWFENTGKLGETQWTQRYIGASPGMHRLKAGHFTRKDRWQIVAVPIVVKSSDYTSAAPVIIYTAPDDPKDEKYAGGWPSEVATHLRLVHEVTVVPSWDDGLDKILFAGREGTLLVWYEEDEQAWNATQIGKGLPETSGNPYWGSGSVALAKVHEDRAGYIATCEAFHGNIVSVYVKDKESPPNQLDGLKWTRHVLDDFGPLNSEHTGSIHFVTCTDVDGDGVDEILVALMGSDPPSWERTGVWCYKPVDLATCQFSKVKLSDDSAGRIVVADFKGRGTHDFATISYSVPGYFESPNPSINIYLNSLIIAEKLGDEVLFRTPNPSSTRFVDEVEFLDVSGRRLSLVVIPTATKYAVADGDGVKVIMGSVSWTDGKGKVYTRGQGVKPQTQVSTLVDAKDGHVHTGHYGAIIMVMKKSSSSGTPPFSDMNQLVAHNIFPERFPNDVRAMSFPWVKVEDRPWAHGGFKDLEFYNLVGFHVRLADDSDQKLCHIQLWTAGVGVSAGFHNHSDASFCEIHACIVNGTGKGGMHWATVPDDNIDPANPDKSKYTGIVVPDMSEHGPLWRLGKDGLPELRKNDTVDYPWHAWIAGAGNPNKKQAFDVWLAFEFPAFLADVGKEIELVPNKFYEVIDPVTKFALNLKNHELVNGTPVVASHLDDDTDSWKLQSIPGTQLYMLVNTKTWSIATVKWPPVSGQTLIGAVIPTKLQTTYTAAWTLEKVGEGYHVRLVGTDLFLTVVGNNHQGGDVFVTEVNGPGSRKWLFSEVGGNVSRLLRDVNESRGSCIIA